MSMYNYYRVIQNNQGHGWQDVACYEANCYFVPPDVVAVRKAYQRCCKYYPGHHRIINRRTPKEE